MITAADGRAQFGRRLRVLREDARLTGKDLADRLGWAQSKVSRLENGKQTATVEDVEAWAQAVRATAEHY
ncbi:MAG: helix-turn-helix domain-containing protein, partial [Actinobacteria bacterium]|nr:helix-turn-helix domain-containing protein [Actinomycetota bacterium]